jgi:sulfide:quinone oxidoreductase
VRLWERPDGSGYGESYGPGMSDFRVVICGGGIAGVEGLLRLRRLAGDSVDIELIAPNDELVYRPMAVREPFAFGPARRYPLRRIAQDTEADWTQDSLAWVDPDAKVVHTGAGRRVEYDALLIAVGARQVEAYEHAATFRDAEADATYHGIVQDVEGGYSRSLAFIQPVGPVWPLPLYELALMTAERAESMDIRDLELALVTPEPRPLAVFGTAVSDVVTSRLARAGIKIYCNSLARVPAARRLRIEPQGVELRDQRIITMPRIAGPAIRGLPGAGAHGFVPIDKHCSVPGTGGRVFAAGDAADYPIKHGGLGSQMADAAAAAIAVLAGAQTAAAAFSPVIRGKLLTGRDPVFMSAHPVGAESFESEVFDSPPWPSDEKVVAEELGPYLTGLDIGATSGTVISGAHGGTRTR